MFAALYGELTPHPWHDPEHDAYFLFHHRSEAMGWLQDDSPGLWAIHEAEWGHPDVAGTGLVSWFQVGVDLVTGHRALPVQPFLRCAADATSRAGELRLEAVQILLPVQIIDVSSRPPYIPSAGTMGWFRTGNPASRMPVRVGVDSGRNPAIVDAAQEIIDRFHDVDQDVFTAMSFQVSEPGSQIDPPFDDACWDGPPRHGITLRGQLAEWSVDAIGWLGEIVADITARLGIRSSILLTASLS